MAEREKSELRESTYEVYDYRVSAIKKYFESRHYKLVDITPKILDTYFKYCLRYGKVNPVIGVSVHGKKNKEYSEEMLFLTEEEISELLHFVSVHYPCLLGITFMGAYYGLRRSESDG